MCGSHNLVRVLTCAAYIGYMKTGVARTKRDVIFRVVVFLMGPKRDLNWAVGDVDYEVGIKSVLTYGIKRFFPNVPTYKQGEWNIL